MGIKAEIAQQTLNYSLMIAIEQNTARQMFHLYRAEVIEYPVGKNYILLNRVISSMTEVI
jgi:hypothetical protein